MMSRKQVERAAKHADDVDRLIELIRPDDADLRRAAFRHDWIEDGFITQELFTKITSKETIDYVMAVTKEGDAFPRLTLEFFKGDVEKYRNAVLLKFCDRLSNLADMEGWDDERKKAYLAKSVFWRTGG